MGAILITKVLPESVKTKRQVDSFFSKLKRKDLSVHKKNKEYWDYILQNSDGNSTDYTGDWATFSGLRAFDLGYVAESKKAAIKEIEDSSQKWGSVIAVKYKNGKKTKWIIGGFAAC